jgi:hypothetical protein
MASQALLALDLRVEPVEVAHKIVVTLLELGRAALVGVGVDLVERLAGLRDDLLALILQRAQRRAGDDRQRGTSVRRGRSSARMAGRNGPTAASAGAGAKQHAQATSAKDRTEPNPVHGFILR